MFHDDSIAGSWHSLVQRIETTDALGRWAVEDDRLAGDARRGSERRVGQRGRGPRWSRGIDCRARDRRRGRRSGPGHAPRRDGAPDPFRSGRSRKRRTRRRRGRGLAARQPRSGTIARRAGNATPSGWPALTAPDDGLVVVDLGLPTPDSLARLAISRCRIVVVCRPTVPGVRLAEQLLNSITGPVIIASVGSGKWPGEVNASLGPRLRELRAANAVVTVPADRRLEVTGPTNSPLPKPVATAGRSLLGLIDVAHSVATTASAQSVPRRKGTDR
jgi:hypothetical protein